jgi:hypothetical protein
MKILFRDFAPDWKNKVLGLAIGGRQSMDTVLQLANTWVAAEGIDVINVETLILPQGAADNTGKGEHDDTRYNVGVFELSAQRIQVLRVWYRQ